jgi:hypothetical protein
LTQSFHPHYGPGVDSTSNRNEHQEYFLGGKGDWCIGLTTLPPSCADCFETWETQPPGTLRACPGVALDLLLERLWLGYHARHTTSIASNHLLERVLVQLFSLYSHCAPIWGQVVQHCVLVNFLLQYPTNALDYKL